MVISGDKENWLVMNQGNKPLVNFNFMLRVEAIYDLPCKSVHNFQKENEYEYIQEGGLNDYVHIRRKPISKPFTFQVERYVGVDLFDPIPNGAELILPVLLMVSRAGNHFEMSKRVYTFTGCTVMSKEFGELSGDKSGLLIETTTISYREMLCVDNPADFEQSMWEQDGTYQGKNQSARTNKSEKAIGKKWKIKEPGKNKDKSIDDDAYQGENQSARTNKSEKAVGKKWEIGTTGKNQSAIRPPSTKAEGKKWEIKKESENQSAKQIKSTGKAEGTKWDIREPNKNTREQKSPSTKAQGRIWLPVRSARDVNMYLRKK